MVDLGYGATPVTAVELRARLAAAVRADVRVVGLEIDPARVAAAAPSADPPADLRPRRLRAGRAAPALVRAFNVLRQYDEARSPAPGRTMTAGWPRAACWSRAPATSWAASAAWLLLDADGPPHADPGRPSCPRWNARPTLAERLPKALIHHNVPGEPIHALLRALDGAWQAAAPATPSSARGSAGWRAVEPRSAPPAGPSWTAPPAGASAS